VRAIVIRGHGGAEVLQAEDLPDPQPAPGEELLEAAPHFFAGRLRTVVHDTLPLAEARRAHETMEASRHFGKIVLTP
jgi:NADPH:quinone reductase-like Zn-dependent oxidoreductase